MLSPKNLQRGSQAIAIIDVIIAVLSLIIAFFILYLSIYLGDDFVREIEKYQGDYPELAAIFTFGRGPFVFSMLILMGVYVFYFYLARYLLYATYDRCHKKIHIWRTISLVIVIIRGAFFLAALFFTYEYLVVLIFGLTGFLYQIFSIFFVRHFESHLRNEYMNDIKLAQTVPQSIFV